MNVVTDLNIKQPLPKSAVALPFATMFEHQILACLGYSLDAPPLADFLRKLRGLSGEWVVVSPVHWQVTHNDVRLAGYRDALNWSDEEAQTYFRAFADFVAADGGRLVLYDRYTWLLQWPESHNLQALSVESIQHKSLLSYLRNLGDDFFWSKFLTSAQIFFKTLPENIVNGIWIWGSGALKTISPPPEMICDDAALDIFAKVLEITPVRYTTKHKYAKTALVLSRNETTLVELALKFKRKTVSWYWANQAYHMRFKFWRM